MRADFAGKLVWVLVRARQQVTGARRRDDVGGAVGPQLRALGGERYPKMQLLAGVGVDRAEQRRIGQLEVGLIERDLGRVSREFSLKAITRERAVIFRVERLAFPNERVIDVGATERIWSCNDNAVGVTTQIAVHGLECARLGWGEPEPGGNQLLADSRLEVMPAGENPARACVKCRSAPPIILHAPQAVRADDGGAEIGMRKLRLPRCGALDGLVERNVDRLVRQLGFVIIVGHSSLAQMSISSFHSSGVSNGPPAAALACRGIVLALDPLLTPLSLRSRAIMSLRISRIAVSKNSIMVSRGQAVTGRDQSMVPQVLASSGRIVATAPASHGSGSSPVRRMVCSVSSCSAAACSARVLIQANNIAARTQPHSVSFNRPTGVPGGMGPPNLTTSRAASMVAAVARRCHSSSRAELETSPMARVFFISATMPAE